MTAHTDTIYLPSATSAPAPPPLATAVPPVDRAPIDDAAGVEPAVTLVMPARLADLDSEHRQLFEEYVTQIAGHLGLERWSLAVQWNVPAPDDCDAQIVIIDGRYAALLSLHDEFFTLTLTEQRRVVVHELLHLHTAAVVSAVNITSKALSKPTRKVGVKLIRDAEEHMVDALSSAIGELLPLPDWSEPPLVRRRPS